MRSAEGYTGPVVHWWQNCLQFTGAGFDWRYEGITIGYVNLYTKTHDSRWLDKAKRAGDDLVVGQLGDGRYRNSTFEQNPHPGGTPHEAACDLGLLRLAQVLRGLDDPAGETYLAAAKRNVRDYHLQHLWQDGSFSDHAGGYSFVPNKAATLVEALFMLAALTDDEKLVECYALPSLDQIIACQQSNGAIDQYRTRSSGKAWYMPYYITRCIPALLEGFIWTGKRSYQDAALHAAEFVLGWQDPGGGLPQIIYPHDRVNHYPRWVAAVGDVIRILKMLDIESVSMQQWLLDGHMANGTFQTARGFASQISQKKPPQRPDFRDVLPVCGWADKTFRYLTECLPTGEVIPAFEAEHLTLECLLRGEAATYHEDEHRIEIQKDGQVMYRWQKGANWAEHATTELIWR